MPDHTVIHTHCAASPAQDIFLDYPGLPPLSCGDSHPYKHSLYSWAAQKEVWALQYELDSDPPDTRRAELSTLRARAVQCLLEQCYRHCKMHEGLTHPQELQLPTSVGLMSVPTVNGVCDHRQTWDSLYFHTNMFSFTPATQ